MANLKKKRMRFRLISVSDDHRKPYFVFMPRREGKLLNISVSIGVRKPVSDMNADETRYERGTNDV